jgi:hypothetical protein
VKAHRSFSFGSKTQIEGVRHEIGVRVLTVARGIFILVGKTLVRRTAAHMLERYHLRWFRSWMAVALA